MKSRTTIWRHQVGKSKKYYPKGQVDYKTVAIHLCRKYFHDLWSLCREDVIQEIELIVLEANQKKRIKGSTKTYGNSKDALGLVLFSRAAQARFHQIRKNYGLYRNKTFFTFIENYDN